MDEITDVALPLLYTLCLAAGGLGVWVLRPLARVSREAAAWVVLVTVWALTITLALGLLW